MPWAQKRMNRAVDKRCACRDFESVSYTWLDLEEDALGSRGEICLDPDEDGQGSSGDVHAETRRQRQLPDSPWRCADSDRLSRGFLEKLTFCLTDNITPVTDCTVLTDNTRH